MHGRGRVRRRTSLAIPALLLWTGSACGSPPPPTQAPTPTALTAAATTSSRADEPNTTDGIYTVAQARRGLEVFNEICSECHETKDWTDAAFLERWEEASVYRLWYWIYERMPHGRPGSLSRQQVTDALQIYYAGGIKPEDMASLVLAATQVGALAFIGNNVD